MSIAKKKKKAFLTDLERDWPYFSLSLLLAICKTSLSLAHSRSLSFLSSPSQLVSMETGFFFSPVIFSCRFDDFAEARTRNRSTLTNCLGDRRSGGQTVVASPVDSGVHTTKSKLPRSVFSPFQPRWKSNVSLLYTVVHGEETHAES